MLNRFFILCCCLLPSRLRLHEGKVIKDRRHHLRTYPNCFVAKELIDWLIEHKEASDRETAIKIMQKLLDQSIIHHGKAELRVCCCIYEIRGSSLVYALCMLSTSYDGKGLSLLLSLVLSFSFLTFSGTDSCLLIDDSPCLPANLAPT